MELRNKLSSKDNFEKILKKMKINIENRLEDYFADLKKIKRNKNIHKISLIKRLISPHLQGRKKLNHHLLKIL